MPKANTVRQRKVRPRVRVLYGVDSEDLEQKLNEFLDKLLADDNWNGGVVYHVASTVDGGMRVLIEWMETLGYTLHDSETGQMLSEETKSGLTTTPTRLIKP